MPVLHEELLHLGSLKVYIRPHTGARDGGARGPCAWVSRVPRDLLVAGTASARAGPRGARGRKREHVAPLRGEAAAGGEEGAAGAAGSDADQELLLQHQRLLPVYPAPGPVECSGDLSVWVLPTGLGPCCSPSYRR